MIIIKCNLYLFQGISLII